MTNGPQIYQGQHQAGILYYNSNLYKVFEVVWYICYVRPKSIIKSFNSLPDDKCIGMTKLKAFADDYSNVNRIMVLDSDRDKTWRGKGKILITSILSFYFAIMVSERLILWVDKTGVTQDDPKYLINTVSVPFILLLSFVIRNKNPQFETRDFKVLW